MELFPGLLTSHANAIPNLAMFVVNAEWRENHPQQLEFIAICGSDEVRAITILLSCTGFSFVVPKAMS
jgi:hypothetical protein